MSQKHQMITERVFEIFKELSAVPRGSGNMTAIADFCEEFAKKNSLECIRDSADNIIIFKGASKGYENAEPVILQGHLDMVCQQTAESTHDFAVNGPKIIFDGDFIKANGTTLGADNGIAVAMVMAILESDELKHPPIEAVFTTDEEIGLLGASALDCSVLKGRRMINLDSEEDDTITVSCAGGSEFKVTVPLSDNKKQGTELTLSVFGLKGGHSGVEINKGRVNANKLMGRILNFANSKVNFEIISVSGGDKSNAITPICNVKLCTDNPDKLKTIIKEYTYIVKKEISAREPNFNLEITVGENSEYKTFGKILSAKFIYFLVSAPQGVINMSAEIEDLVETSLNLGVINTTQNELVVIFSLRSNKVTALEFLKEMLYTFTKCLDGEIETYGDYPPWEFKSNSALQSVYIDCFKEHYGNAPKVEAIHAGLECGVFSLKIDGLDCVAVGPTMCDVHTVNEKLSISSTENFFELLIKVLEKLA